MTIAPVLLRRPYPMSEEQRAIISHKQGPLLIIAGPGSGKTRSLLLLAMNLLLCGDAQPSELILCTYTEKAVREMQDRFIEIARAVEYQQDLARLRIGTIHSICKQLITENNHYLPIENDFITLDEFTRHLLIFEEIDTICTPGMKRFFQKRWGSLWQMAKELGSSFDKITEELLFEKLKAQYEHVALASLQTDNDLFRAYLTHAYRAYQKILAQRNCLDFAHLQKCVYNLLQDPKTFPHLTKGIRYVLVDEYQDTNYIQEKILTQLASATGSNNLFVVGDEDQALYRFRGATVRNILEFEQTFPGCKTLRLMTNYRSHQTIIDVCNTWIKSIDWLNSQGLPFRTEKRMCTSQEKYADYPAVCTLTFASMYDEAEQFADVVVSLKQQGKIQDYSQVALLLHSVKPGFSAPYIHALEKRKIASFCPRAMSYFDHVEVQLLFACFARILDFEKGSADRNEDDSFASYLDTCCEYLRKVQLSHLNLQSMLVHMIEEITYEEQGSVNQGKSLLDYFYRLVTVNPFLYTLKGASNQDVPPHHLERVSALLQTFQRYYCHTEVTYQKRRVIAYDFFQRFLPLLYSNGWNYEEVSSQAFPEGHVPILTIHQAKGLEFPVVVVGRLDKIFVSSDNQKHQALQEFSPRKPFEPDARIPNFDLRRLYYVAFSRAKNLLVLMAVRNPGKPLAVLWQDLPSWSSGTLKNMPELESWEKPLVPRPRYGLTNDIQLYMTCPRQFQFFRTYNFTPSHNDAYFSGQLVHHTLEYIHRMARDGKLEDLNEGALLKIFERKFQALTQSYLSSIDSEQKTRAWQQVMRYLQQNWGILDRIDAAELSVQIDKPEYILTGTIDLLVKTAGGVDLIDFKTSLPRPGKNAAYLELYEQQIHFYAHALEQSRGQRPERLFLYWTAEKRKEDALMEIPYQAEKIKKMNTNLESVAENIKNERFHVHKPPAVEVCKRCDIRHLCRQDRVIEI